MKFTAMQEFAIETCVRAARRIIAHEGTTFTPPTAVFALQSEKGPLSFRAGGRRKRNRFQSVIYSFMRRTKAKRTLAGSAMILLRVLSESSVTASGAGTMPFSSDRTIVYVRVCRCVSISGNRAHRKETRAQGRRVEC